GEHIQSALHEDSNDCIGLRAERAEMPSSTVCALIQLSVGERYTARARSDGSRANVSLPLKEPRRADGGTGGSNWSQVSHRGRDGRVAAGRSKGASPHMKTAEPGNKFQSGLRGAAMQAANQAARSED